MHKPIQGSQGPQRAQGVQRSSQPPGQQPQEQNSARPSYSYRDSRHVYREGGAATQWAFPEESADFALLGLLEGDILELQSEYALNTERIEGALEILSLSEAQMEFALRLSIPAIWQSEAAAAFVSLCAHSLALHGNELQLHLSLQEDPRGGYLYEVRTLGQNHILLRDRLDVRLDEWDSDGTQRELLTLMTPSQNHLQLSLDEGAPRSGEMRLSLLPGLGDFQLLVAPRS